MAKNAESINLSILFGNYFYGCQNWKHKFVKYSGWKSVNEARGSSIPIEKKRGVDRT